MTAVLNSPFIPKKLTPSDKSEVIQLHNKIGWFVFSITDITQVDVTDEPIEFDGQKTLSDRLHNVLFRLHEKQGGKPEGFKSYRAKIMETLISRYKAKLDDPLTGRIALENNKF